MGEEPWELSNGSTSESPLSFFIEFRAKMCSLRLFLSAMTGLARRRTLIIHFKRPSLHCMAQENSLAAIQKKNCHGPAGGLALHRPQLRSVACKDKKTA
jgi:hypothetical protein